MTVVARTPARAEALRRWVTSWASGWTSGRGRAQLPAADLVVSTVVSGAADASRRRWPASAPLIFDIIYDPWPTVLAAAAERAGCTVVSGLDLLVGQALLQIELMTGRSVAADVLYAALPAEVGIPTRRATTRARLLIMLRWLTAGESHGPALVAILEGLPAHVTSPAATLPMPWPAAGSGSAAARG